MPGQGVGWITSPNKALQLTSASISNARS
jgi:hypothetical protein